jgi:hypothetical protein
MNFSSYDINENIDELLSNFNSKINLIEVQNVYIYFFYVVNQSCDMYKREIETAVCVCVYRYIILYKAFSLFYYIVLSNRYTSDRTVPGE